MVKFYSNNFSFGFDWTTVTYAYLNRYPNPFAAHVFSSDTLGHRLDPITGNLHISKLHKKTNSTPYWARHFVKNTTAYILEEIVINNDARSFSSKQRNITHTRLLVVEDSLLIVPAPSPSPSLSAPSDSVPVPVPSTLCHSEGRLFSNFGYGIGSRIEIFSFKRISDNLHKSRKGLAYSIDRIRERCINSLSVHLSSALEFISFSSPTF
ncbi:Protein UPS1, mitochondrial [Smittium mucronatum]|uniref:Protein UPS1, mitochondrial n=1 Tax=Smittium mucronatum TaxID=133383 RepID=A0A1R0GVH8_9FUNG|nr:Protein UPS1, mitochondrial [Smittium mucronatum]